jgi:hypothetical protein
MTCHYFCFLLSNFFRLLFTYSYIEIRVVIFRENIIPRNTEQTEVLIHSVGIPSVSRKGKHSEFRYEPFRIREKHCEVHNFVPNHSAKLTKHRSKLVMAFAQSSNL